MDKKPSLFTVCEAELIAPAWKVFGFDSPEKFKVVIDMITKDMIYIFARGHQHYTAGICKQLAKMDYPRELVLFVYTNMVKNETIRFI